VRSTKNRRLFSQIATRYDFLNHLLSFNIDKSWRKKLVESAGTGSKESILDVCTGTADIAIRFAQKDSVGKIVGIDQSEEMLDIARRKIKTNGFGRKITLLKGNALDLPFEDGSFDIVSIGFGLRNIGYHKKAISEMARVLKNGGKLLILEFSPPPKNLFGSFYSLFLKTILTPIGGIISGSSDAYRFLSKSIVSFPKPEEIIKFMEGENLSKVSCEELTFGVACIYRGEK